MADEPKPQRIPLVFYPYAVGQRTREGVAERGWMRPSVRR